MAEGSISVSISSVNGLWGGLAMVSWSGLTKLEARIERAAVERDPPGDEAVAVENERGVGPAQRIWADVQARDDPRRRRVELDIEIDLVDQIVGRPVVFQANGLGAVGTHQNLNLWEREAGLWGRKSADHRACIDAA